MAVLVNKNTTGAPMSTVGRTGDQVIRFIPAPRVYMKDPDSITAAPIGSYFEPSNGTTPNGWQDLGTVEGNATITYDKTKTEIRTGIDQYLRMSYISAKTCTVAFELTQFDDVNIELLTDFTGSVITTGSVVNYQLGQEDIVNKALLLVLQNKLDKKEFQFYNPNAEVSFTFNNGTNGMTLAVSCSLPAFIAEGRTDESFLSVTEFAV